MERQLYLAFLTLCDQALKSAIFWWQNHGFRNLINCEIFQRKYALKICIFHRVFSRRNFQNSVLKFDTELATLTCLIKICSIQWFCHLKMADLRPTYGTQNIIISVVSTKKIAWKIILISYSARWYKYDSFYNVETFLWVYFWRSGLSYEISQRGFLLYAMNSLNGN